MRQGRAYWRPYAVLGVLACMGHAVSAAWWPFPPKRFAGNGLLPAGPLGLDTEERVIAFGDFNGDQYLDVLTLGSDGRTLSVRLWRHDAFTFVKADSFKHPRRVHNVIPGDFTQDGKLDLLVVADGSGSDSLSMTVYAGRPEGGFSMNPINVPPSSSVQPFALDANGDLRIDLLGQVPSSSSTFKIWQNVWNSSNPGSSMFNVIDANLQGEKCKISSSHSNAVVDLDGDCLADLFIVCDAGNANRKHFQIWTNSKSSGFALAQSGELPPGTQTISFADIDRDGAVDMVFATCSDVARDTGVGSNCYLNIAYNVQLPLCPSTTSPSVEKGKKICRPLDALCMSDPAFHFDFQSADTYQRIPFTSLLPSASGLLVVDPSFSPSTLPLPVRAGDVDLDGFPDLLFIRAGGDKHRDHEYTPTLLMNVACGEKNAVGCEKGGRRAWKAVKKGADALENIKDARGATFIDVDEDGTLDILVQRTGKEKLSFVQNNFYHDAFFLKAIVLNSVCPGGWCTAPNGSNYHPYGVSFSGGTFKYTVIGTTGSRSAAQVAQLPQTAYHALQAPYAFLGLGRTNNYIEALFVGSTSHAREHYTALEGVVPNSRVVALPSRPGQSGEGDTAWRTELFLRPGSWIHWVGATVVVVLIMLSGIVAGLHIAEKRADEKERRMASHHINFDAL